MPSRLSLRPAALALALGLAGPAAQALNIVVHDAGATPMSALQMSALQTAANYWSNKLTDNVTVYLDVSFKDLGPTALGATDASLLSINYSTLRSRLVSDAKTATDATAVAHLQGGSALSFYATQGDLSTRLDNDGSTNNKVLTISTANYKALGLNPGTSAELPDAKITFNSSAAASFAYTRVGGQIPGDKLDFITVAEHEIGHALGFLSGLDAIDTCVDHPAQCGLSTAANRFENSWWYYPLDVFRYSAPGKMDLTLGGSPYLSVDGGATAIQAFSTGEAHGNGEQASHFGTSALTLMRPFVLNGQSYDATASDLIALDAIGWDLAAAVPEPAQYALLLGGLAAIGVLRRRQRG